MGEIFRREAAEHAQPFTGERLTAAAVGQVAIEHYHRYLLARSLAVGLDVLDVACGEGYGSALLAQVARSVIGADYSATTIRCAADGFPRANLRFMQGDARALPLADDCVDLVVSFETIEHFDRQDDFLGETYRVLRPGGRLLISTPDRDVYSPAGTAPNVFHAQELSHGEFAAMLRKVFRHVLIVRQRPVIGSALLADVGSAATPLVVERRGEAHFEACVGLPRAPYLIALASDLEPSPLPPSVYIERSDLDTDASRCQALSGQLQVAETELAQVRKCSELATQRAEQAEQRAEQAEQRVEQAEQRAEQTERCAEQALLRAELAERHAEQNAQELAQAMRLAQQEAERAEQAERTRMACEDRYEALRRDYHVVQGSLRTFLRFYLPRLRRHMLGQRP